MIKITWFLSHSFFLQIGNEKVWATNKWCCKVYAVVVIVMMGFEATTPMVAPFGSNTQRPDHWKHFDDSVNAVSFGFVATAILISMFLLLAIFERFLRQRSSEANNVATPIDLERQMHFGRKLENLSPKVHFNTSLPLISFTLMVKMWLFASPFFTFLARCSIMMQLWLVNMIFLPWLWMCMGNKVTNLHT